MEGFICGECNTFFGYGSLENPILLSLNNGSRWIVCSKCEQWGKVHTEAVNRFLELPLIDDFKKEGKECYGNFPCDCPAILKDCGGAAAK